MKRTSRLLLISLILVTFAALANAQAAMSLEKRKLVGEMIAVLKMDKQMSQITDAMLEEMEKTYPMGYGAAVDRRADLTDQQKQSMKTNSAAAFTAFSQKFRRRLAESVDYAKYIDEAVYPMYDKIYSEQELRDIVAFYKTPTGQKMIDTMPQLFAEAQNAAREKLLPQVMTIISSVLDEEFKTVAAPSPKKPSN
ncbi:MAG TPA: DUF2059 domain-containing protein [Pyrinomonadaceae bacterium]|nr:DUF2059 domain-containing protein [Pyrinomonadaceae bacterium]